MICNIDRRGRKARGITGSCLMVMAIGFAVAAWLTSADWFWLPAIFFAALGGFTLFEAANGWCALRAMGIKTRI